MKFDAMSDKGRVRENNEDSYFIPNDENFPLFIVADGIGGHKSGEIASNMTVDIIKNNLKTNIKRTKTKIKPIISVLLIFKMVMPLLSI